jgi:hypothetical protein
MCRTLFAALATVTILASGVFAGGRAAAMMVAPSTLGGAKADARLVQPATNVCGTNGCVRVQTSPPRKKQTFNRHP